MVKISSEFYPKGQLDDDMNKSIERFNNNKINAYMLYIPSREDIVDSTIKMLGFDVEKVQGIDKNTLNLNDLLTRKVVNKKWYDNSMNYHGDEDSYYNKNHYTKVSHGGNQMLHTGPVAVYLGHRKILDQFLASNEEYALIFEDDIDVENENHGKKIKSMVHQVLKNFPEDIDIIYLDFCWEFCNSVVEYSDLFNIPLRPLCMHAYMVSRNGAMKILSLLPMEAPFDTVIAKKIHNGEIRALSLKDQLLSQKVGSTVSETRENMKQLRCVKTEDHIEKVFNSYKD